MLSSIRSHLILLPPRLPSSPFANAAEGTLNPPRTPAAATPFRICRRLTWSFLAPSPLKETTLPGARLTPRRAHPKRNREVGQEDLSGYTFHLTQTLTRPEWLSLRLRSRAAALTVSRVGAIFPAEGARPYLSLD